MKVARYYCGWFEIGRNGLAIRWIAPFSTSLRELENKFERIESYTWNAPAKDTGLHLEQLAREAQNGA